MTDQLALPFDAPPPEPGSERGSAASTDSEPLPGRAAPALVASIAEVAHNDRLGRKLLVGTTRGEGRELLRSLARTGTPWLGFEAMTLRPLAVEAVADTLHQRGLRIVDRYQVTALIDEAIDAVLSRRSSRFAELSDAVGFRRAIEGAVLALRMAGITAEVLRRTPFDDRQKREVIAKALEHFEAGLEERGEVDTAGLFAVAADRLGEGPVDRLSSATIVLLPGLSARGHAGRFVTALQTRGAFFLADDRVLGVDPPADVFAGRAGPAACGSYLGAPSDAPESQQLTIDVFAATTVTAELREVLRRVAAQGIPWDQVEILTPDPRAYGSAFHALAESLDVPVTFGMGLPVERTRPGRACAEYFRWIDSGFSAEVLRGLLEAGDLRPPDDFDWLSPMELTRRFRELRIGWGRARHRRRLERRIASLERMEPSRHESREHMERRRTRVQAELEALQAILAPVLSALPDGVPDPSAGPESGPVSPSDLARATLEFLRHVPARDGVDETALHSLRSVLERIERSWHRKTHYRAAAAIVRSALRVNVSAPRSEGRAPWSSTPGHVYFADLEYGGLANRAHTFVVGMDAGRFPGSGLQDPLLLDRERDRLSPHDLPTSSRTLAERVFAFHRAFARMRGSVTVSYATWEPAEARELSPSAEALAALRLSRRDPTLSFDALRTFVGRPVGALPRQRESLDGRDVWLSAINEGGRLLDGRTLVADCFPGIRRGSAALAAPAQDEPTSHIGCVRARPLLDPRASVENVLSASRLEHLGTCPRRYLYSSVLKLRAPDDPDYKADRWLSPLARGDVLHRVFEATLRKGREEPDTSLEQHADKALRRELARATELHPTPSREIQERERARLREDVQSFLRLVEERGAEWIALELKFGFDDVEAATIRLLPEGEVRLRGAIDRLDGEPDSGPTVVVDYKTGSAYNADRDTGLFHGGRRLQNVLYTMAVHDLLGRPVARMEYQYATQRARNSVLAFEADQLRAGPFVVGRMMDGVAAGHFVPTDDPQDCRWCDFSAVCRVRTQGNSLRSPAAEWTSRWMRRAESEPNALPDALKELRDVRREDAPALLPPPLWSPGGDA